MKTGVYNGWIMFPSGYANFKLYEVGKYYTEIGFGAITWHGLTVNLARWNKLPKEVQDIILQVAHEYELKTGTVNKADYPKQIAEIKAHGGIVRTLPEKVRQEWAQSLASWPAQKAKELDAKGLPATRGTGTRDEDGRGPRAINGRSATRSSKPRNGRPTLSTVLFFSFRGEGCR